VKIPFNRPFIVGKELHYISQAVQSGHLAGDGEFTKRCHAWLEQTLGAKKVLLTHSCTAALEMGAILCNVSPGDEIIMPSFTFVSTANAFVLRGARLRFVDIREDTLNIDEALIEGAIAKRSRAIVPIHYAGVAAEMDSIQEIAHQYGLAVIEDAAQGVNATYKGRYLGTIGDLGAFSFHETKNFISGEGGALVVNDDLLVNRAEIIREKGTNRSQFFRGEVDKYTWVDIGSSYLPSEITAAFLYAQLQEAECITEKRWKIWRHYQELLEPIARRGLLRTPILPDHCQHNAHMYYILLPTEDLRDGLIGYLKENDIWAVFHYVPLHTSPMGRKFGVAMGDLAVTEDLSSRLVRLPCYFGLELDEVGKIVEMIGRYLLGR
jgi:dTDP-4-amino-4,6-dideoxygalactose transaminase